jgi:gliding motility-associated lipoprotein GldD
MYRFLASIFISSLLFLAACNSPFTTKNKGYASIQLPSKSYQIFNETGYPYTFEFPSYAQIDNNVNYFGASKKTDSWINIHFPTMGATLYVSYSKMKVNQLDTLIQDAYTFANNHNSKASSISDSLFSNAHGVEGVFFHIGGDVATSYQFFITDSTTHFFRGALYFDTTPNEDSLAPVNDFLYKDLKHLVNTFRWK